LDSRFVWEVTSRFKTKMSTMSHFKTNLIIIRAIAHGGGEVSNMI